MAPNLKDLKIRFVVDSKGAIVGIRTAKGEIVDLGTASGVASAKGQKLNSSFKELGPTMKKVGIGIGVLLVGLGKSILVAGDAAEVWSKFEAVFKEGAEDTREWVNQFSADVGRARSDVADWASTLQDTFVPMGIARSEAAELSKTMVELAVDVASFSNKQDADVIRDFQSALVGNTETVRKYGIVINETNTEQEAINSGLVDANGVITDQIKLQARLQLIMKGTSDAQGDAKRTADGFNNSLKAMFGAVKDLTDEFGGEFLPVAADVVQAITAFVKELDPQRIKQIVVEIGILTTGFVFLKVAILLATGATIGLTAAMKKGGLIAVFVLLGIALDKVITGMNAFEDAVSTDVDALTELQQTLEEEEATLLRLRGSEDAHSFALIEQGVVVKNLRIEVQALIAAEKLLDEQRAKRDESIRKGNEAIEEMGEITNVATRAVTFFHNELLDIPPAVKLLGNEMEVVVDFANLLTDTLSSAFDPNTKGGEAFKTFILGILTLIEAVILASGVMSAALVTSFIPGLGVAGAAAALVGLEAAKAGVRALEFGEGGSFTVPGNGPRDSVFVPMRVSPDETVTIETPQQRRSNGRSVIQNITLNGPIDREWFREVAAPQLEEDARRAMNKLAIV